MTKRTTLRSTRRRGRLTAVLTLAAALAVPATLLAQPPGGGHARGPGHGPGGYGEQHRPDAPREMRLLHGLELDADQRDAIHELLDSSRGGLEATQEAARAVRAEIRTAVHAETFDESAIREATGRLATIEADLAVGRARTWQLIREQLTDEQRAELAQRIADAGERGERRRVGRRGRPHRFGQGQGGF